MNTSKVLLFLITIFTLLIFINSTLSAEITEPIQDGDYIYIDDSKAYLKGTYSATHGEDIEHWAMTKQFTGDCDMAIGFNGEVARPTKVLLEDYHYVNWTTNQSHTFYYVNNFAQTTDNQDYGNLYNLLKYKFDHKIYIGYDNATNESIWQDVIGTVAYFDSQTNDGTNYTITWHTEHSRLEQYWDISNRILSNPIEYEYDCKNLWFITKNIPMTANEMRKIVIEMDGKMEWGVGNSYKYDIIWKPSDQSIVEARATGNLYVLDPLWNSSYDIRLKMPINNTAGAGVQTDFQINTNISAYSANASSLRCYNRTTGNIISHWNESVVGGDVYELWTNNSVIASGWDNNTFCAWQTTPIASSSSSGTDTFLSFFDGDLSGWTEVDPNSHISFANNRLEWSGLDRDEDAYVYQANANVNGYIAIEFTSYVTSFSNSGFGVIGAIGDMLDDWNNLDNGINSFRYYPTNTYLGKKVSDVATSSAVSVAISTGTQYWSTTTVDRSGNAETKMYSDSARTTQVGSTMVLDVSDVVATLDNVFLVLSYNIGNNIHTITGWMDDFKVYEYNSTPPVYESLELEYYIPSLYYNTTPVLNIIYSSPHEYALNQTLIGKTNTNDTAGSTGLSEIEITNFDNAASIVRNFTLTGDDLDWYQAANLSSSYSMKNSTGTVQTVADGNFTVNLVAGDYWIEATTPIISAPILTPSTLYYNSTGTFNVSWVVEDNSLNNTTVSMIWKPQHATTGFHNWSYRWPTNVSPDGWRADNRNGTLNFESNTTITNDSIYEWAGCDENCSRVAIIPINSTHTYINFTGYIQDTIHENSHYINRNEMQESIKTVFSIYKNHDMVAKIFDPESDIGHDHIVGLYLDAAAFSALTPTDTLSVFIGNNSWSPTGSIDIASSSNGAYITSFDDTDWQNHVYQPHANSSYVVVFFNTSTIEINLTASPYYYIVLSTNSPSSKPFNINVTNVATTTNKTFANLGVLWQGSGAPYTVHSYTPNIFIATSHANMQWYTKLYVADNNGVWGNSTESITNIDVSVFPPTTSSICGFVYDGAIDSDMNGTYSGTYDVRVLTSSDPDGGAVTSNLTIHYKNETIVGTINGSIPGNGGDCINVSFDSTTYYSATEEYTLRVVATDDESSTSTYWLPVNFSLGLHVSGTVYGGDNIGLEDVSMTLGTYSTTTASDGTFLFTGISDGSHTLTSYIDGYDTLSKTVIVSGADVTGQDFYYDIIVDRGGGGGSGGYISIIEVLDEDGEVIGKAIAIGKPREAWFTIDLVSISNLLSGKDTKNVWNILAIFSIFLMVIGFFDKSKTARGELLLVAGLVFLIIFSINRFDLINIGKSINQSFDIWNGVIIVSAITFIYGFFFDKSKTNRREFLTVIGFVGIGFYAIYQSKLAVVIGFG